MHHAYLCVGKYDEVLERIPLEDREPSPDFRIFQGARLGIDEVRTLIYEAQLRPFVRERRVFVVAYASITHEAQNALLKLFEEPPQTARFYIIIPREAELLPTLLSRLMWYTRTGESTHDEVFFSTFLNMTLSERLSQIAERVTAKDDVWIELLMRGMEAYAAKNRSQDLIFDILISRRFIESPGASKKMLLEHLALALP